MINKTERYFVVSESELERLHSVAFSEGVVFCGEENGDDGTYDYERFKSEDNSNLSMDACCARPVRFIGAADQGSSLMLWGEVKK